MNTLRAMRNLRELACDDRGTTAIEYSIIAAGVAGVLIAVVASIGTSLNTMYTSVLNGFN